MFFQGLQKSLFNKTTQQGSARDPISDKYIQDLIPSLFVKPIFLWTLI